LVLGSLVLGSLREGSLTKGSLMLFILGFTICGTSSIMRRGAANFKEGIGVTKKSEPLLYQMRERNVSNDLRFADQKLSFIEKKDILTNTLLFGDVRLNMGGLSDMANRVTLSDTS